MNMPAAQPGWYPSPTAPGMIQYWDGANWTGQMQPAAPTQPYGAQPVYVASAGTNGMAIASMVLGILWLYWIGSVLALVFGYVALSQLKSRPQGGRGMAIAGVVLGWVGIAVLVVLIIVGITASDSMTYY